MLRRTTENKPFQTTKKITYHFSFQEETFKLTIKFNPKDTVSDLKKRLSSHINVHSSVFYITTRTKVLLDHVPLSFFSTVPIFYIMFRLNGGSNIEDPEVCSVAPISNRSFFLDKNNLPDTWLMLLDFSFSGRRISSLSKAQHLLSLLPTELLQSSGPEIIKIMNSTEIDHYAEICSTLRAFYKPSESDLFHSYFRTQSLGNLSPSAFLTKAKDDLSRLHPGHPLNLDIIKRFFLAVLPDTVRAILAGSEKSSLEELAIIADNIISHLPSPNISALDTPIHDLIRNLSDQVASLKLEVASNKRSRSPIRSYSEIKFRNRSKSTHTLLCNEHHRFNTEAKKCCLGCSWSGNNTCEIIQICIYHHLFKDRARRCLEGCQFQ